MAKAIAMTGGAGTGSPPPFRRLSRAALAGAAAATILVAAGAGSLLGPGGVSAAPGRAAVATSQSPAEQALDERLKRVEAAVAATPDWARVAASVEPSVFTIVAGDSLGSAWVVASDRSGSQLVTNFHVVAATWRAGGSALEVHQQDQVYAGQIARVDTADDLAVITVKERFPRLLTASRRPPLAEAVMAVGSPLGLDGSVATGIVAGFRSLDGSDYLQFTAPISPGNSGGPLVDSRGVVVGVTTAKEIGEGVEALAFAIPVQTACLTVAQCQDQAP